jgi:hypothetical protein
MSELIGINLNINQIHIQTPPRSNNYLIANQREVEKKNIEQKTVELISYLLKGICDKNESQPINFNSNILKPFTTKTRPSISIKDYLLRLSKFTKMEESTMILVLIYIDRICNYNKIQLLYQNIFKIILASAFVAIKFNEDIHYSLEVYAKIGGVPPSELEYLEFHFLILIKFALNVNKTLYDKYSESLTSFQDDDEEEEEEENEEEENL